MFSPECLEISPGGLPHSGILGLTFALNYPRLIAEFYALHRLLVPRHPPCALCSLTHLSTLLNADDRRVAVIVSRNGSLRVFCLVTLKSLSSLFIFEGTYRGAGIRAAAARPAALRTHGDDQIRTGDPLLAKQVLSQLSYIPKWDLFT